MLEPRDLESPVTPYGAASLSQDRLLTFLTLRSTRMSQPRFMWPCLCPSSVALSSECPLDPEWHPSLIAVFALKNDVTFLRSRWRIFVAICQQPWTVIDKKQNSELSRPSSEQPRRGSGGRHRVGTTELDGLGESGHGVRRAGC